MFSEVNSNFLNEATFKEVEPYEEKFIEFLTNIRKLVPPRKRDGFFNFFIRERPQYRINRQGIN